MRSTAKLALGRWLRQCPLLQGAPSASANRRHDVVLLFACAVSRLVQITSPTTTRANTYASKDR